jgi:hypothetical protein
MPDTTTLLSKFLYGTLPQMEAGPGGVIERSTTQAATIADTNETTLFTFSLPANTLSENGKGVRITAFGTYGATVNNKTIKVKFGATTIADTGAAAANGTAWHVIGTILRTGAATQLTSAVRMVGAFASGSGVSMPTTPAEDTTAAIAIVVTGTNGTAAANDIVFRGAVVELL